MTQPDLYVTEVRADWRTADEQRLYDAYRVHQTLCEACFTDELKARQKEPNPERLFLWRLDRMENGFRLWLLSRVQPKPLPWNQSHRETKPVAFRFTEGRRFLFSLRANPTKKTVPEGMKLRNDDGTPVNWNRFTKRVPVLEQDALRAWLKRKGEGGGFTIDESPDSPFVITKEPRERMEIGTTNARGKDTQERVKNPNKDLRIHSVLFEGTLVVTNEQLMAETFCKGIGSAKGLGFGMLLLAPVP
jgi:CRISPR system Cascade subunit CasE